MSRKREEPQLEKKRGIITLLNFSKGYGFIQCPQDGDGVEYFLHASDVVEEVDDDKEVDKFETLNTGDKVEFTPLYSAKKKGWKALGVRVVEGN